MNVPMSFASGLYDRMVPLYTGEVKVDGVDLTFVPIDTPVVLFEKMLDGEFDAGEWSSADALGRGGSKSWKFVAIPVFPSRVFRHGTICVHRDSGITLPKDLEGKRVGVPDFLMTAALWIRGLLQHEYGVDLTALRWVQEAPFRPESAVVSQEALATKFSIERNTSGKPLPLLLEEGAIDAFLGADIPETLRRSAVVRRLFPNYADLDRSYYRRTKVFPIHHTIVIRKEVYERHPFVAKSLFDALTHSKDVARKRMRYMGTLRYMLPWMIAEIEELDALFEGDPFAYGLEPNRKTLETELQYLEEQAMLPRPTPLDEVFADVGT
jgi:4,5-dihydroxyphthalate decarboxylase